jgi:hypothetical protein
LAAKKRRNKSGGPVPGAAAKGGPAFLDAGWFARKWVRWLLLAGLVWLLLAILYPGPVFEGLVFRSSDAGNADAFERAGDQALATGGYPLWNPYLFAGMPSFGSVAYIKYVYPPTPVFNFMQNQLWFPPLTWMLGHMLFGGLGMIWLLSRWKLPVGHLILGAAIWLLFPKVVAWGVHGHGSKLMAAMYLPWILGWALKVMDGGGRRAVGMTGLLLGMQLLGGHPQITYYTLLVVGWLIFWNTVRPFEAEVRALSAAVRWRRLGLVVAGLALGFLVSAILLLPVYEYSHISIRGQDTAGGGGVGLDYATGWSLAPAETASFILPSASGFGKATYLGHMPFNDYPNYFGVLIILLAAVAWSRGSRRLLTGLGVMILVAVAISFGNHGFGFYEWLYGWLPFFNKFRIPSMILITVAFALAILAPRGVAAWQKDEEHGIPSRVLPVLLGATGLVFLLGGTASLFEGAYESGLAALAEAAGRQAPQVLLDEAWKLHRADLIRIGLILLTAGAAFMFALRNAAFRTRGLVWVLVILAATDLLAVDRRITHPERSLTDVGRDSAGRGMLVGAAALERPYVRADLERPGPAAETLARVVGHDRVWPLGQLGGQNLWMADGIRSLGGYHAAKLASYEPIRQRLFSEPLGARIASWLGGSVVAFTSPFGQPEIDAFASFGCELDPAPLFDGGPWFYRNRSALPRARLVSAWQPVDSLPQGDALEPFLDGIRNGDIDVRGTVYLAAPPDPEPVGAAGELPVPVFTTDGVNEVVLETDSPVPALLLLADMMAPGWDVEVDGRDADLLEADLVLRAVALPAGKHTVRFHYSDPAVRAGLGLTLAGALVILILLWPAAFLPRDRSRGITPTGDVAADE